MGSPVPAYTISGLEGATWTAPILSTFFTWSKTGNQVTPALVVFQIPPSGVLRHRTLPVLAYDAGDGGDSSAVKWPHVAPAEARKEARY